MPEGQFTITYLGVEKPAADWGLNAQPRLSLPKSRAKKFTWKMAGADPAGAIPFPFEAAVTIKLKDAAGATVWQMQGYQTTEQGVAIPGQRGIFLIFEDTWYDFENTPFQQAWNLTPTGPLINFSRLYLFLDMSVAPSGYLTVAQQIAQIITWAQSCGVAIQPGIIEGPSQMPWYPARGLSCAAAIEKCLFCFPDLYAWIDDSTTPPTFNCRQRANLTEVIMQWAGTDAAGRRHKSSRITPLYKLQPSQVVLQYQLQNRIDGQTFPIWDYDTWPAGSDGKARRALVVPIDIRGAQMSDTTLKETWTVAGFNPTSLDFWIGNRSTGQFGKVASLGNPDISELAFKDSFVCMSDAEVIAHPNGISITDSAGNYYGLAGLNEHKKGVLCTWLQNPNGTGVTLNEVTVKASFSYKKDRKLGAVTIPGLVAATHKHHTNVKLTNAPVGVTVFEISGLQNFDSGEQPVPNLAQNIYESLNQLQHDGTHEVIDPQPSIINPQPIIGPWNVLTLTGGRADWLRMNIASVEIDFSAGRNNAWRNTTINLGPARHLSPQDLNNYLQFFRARIMDDAGTLRSGGIVANNAAVDMGGEGTKQDTVPSTPDQSLGSFAFTDNGPGGTGNTFSFQHDAQTQQASYVEYNAAGAPLGSAVMVRLFHATGMAAGTQTAGILPAIAGYKLYDLCLDPDAKSLWVCSAAGTYATSTWAQISGGGGGGSISIYDWTKAYTAGVQVIIEQTQVLNAVLIAAGVYACIVPVPASAALNQIPQYPEPSALDANGVGRCWVLVSFRPQPLSQCGQASSNFVNATTPVNL